VEISSADTAIAASAFKNFASLKRISSSNIITVGAQAFEGCSKLTDTPNQARFAYDCGKLFPESDGSYYREGTDMCMTCPSVEVAVALALAVTFVACGIFPVCCSHTKKR
jgi:hypothetical protein